MKSKIILKSLEHLGTELVGANANASVKQVPQERSTPATPAQAQEEDGPRRSKTHAAYRHWGINE